MQVSKIMPQLQFGKSDSSESACNLKNLQSCDVQLGMGTSEFQIFRIWILRFKFKVAIFFKFLEPKLKFCSAHKKSCCNKWQIKTQQFKCEEKCVLFDWQKHAYLMKTNALDATKMLLGFDRFFCFAHFTINPRAGSIFVIF